MANYNPNTSGLISLSDRDNNERTTIATQGGVASGKKRRELKRLYDIIQGYRQDNNTDPVETAVKSLFEELMRFDTSLNDIIKALQFIKSLEPDAKQEAQQQVVYKYVTTEEIKKVDEHINSVIGDINDEPD